jgi:GT2 family glycosyltransferase
MFAEDSEICDNSILNGFKNAIFNDAFALHIGGTSSTKTLRTHYRRFWHLGWSKTKYKQKRKKTFNFIRSTLRIFILYFCEGIFYFLLQNKEKSIQKFAFCFGSFACLIGIKAFDKNNNPRG